MRFANPTEQMHAESMLAPNVHVAVQMIQLSTLMAQPCLTHNRLFLVLLFIASESSSKSFELLTTLILGPNNLNANGYQLPWTGQEDLGRR